MSGPDAAPVTPFEVRRYVRLGFQCVLGRVIAIPPDDIICLTIMDFMTYNMIDDIFLGVDRVGRILKGVIGGGRR